MSLSAEFRTAACARQREWVETPILVRLRERAEVWTAAVYWSAHPAGVTDAQLDLDLGRMRTAGFPAVRFHEIQPPYLGGGRWDLALARRWLAAADRAGLRVVVCCEVFHRPPPELLREHGVAAEDFDRGWFEDPAHRAVLRAYAEGFIAPLRGRAAAWCVLGEPGPSRPDLRQEPVRADFARWLERTYLTLEALVEAWRVYPGEPGPASFAEAACRPDPALSAEISGVHRASLSYGAARDLSRYAADRQNTRADVLARIVAEADPETPVGVGSHQLFINQPRLGWDTGGWARAGDLHTVSIHLSWHFDPVGGEVDVPVWLQARLARDYRKGGFTSAYETTGGPVQFSGGYGNHMDAGLMRRLCLAYLAAGHQALAFWTWNSRPGGWEQGEYGLTGLSGEPMPWAYEAGRIARALERYRREWWETAEPSAVGVVESWDTDAILASEPERHDASQGIPGPHHSGVAGFHRRALIGAGRALTNGQIDFAYVAAEELRRGSGGAYDTLLLPWHRAVDPALLEILRAYAEAGGRVVVDAQFAFCDHHGRILPRGPGSLLESLLGGWCEAVHDARTGGPTWQGNPVRGFWADFTPTRARPLARFEDGRPALFRHALGRGEVLACTLDPALAALRPGQSWAESLLQELCQTGLPDWRSSIPQTVRRRSPAADHYFLHNPGPATTAWVRAATTYGEVRDVLADHLLDRVPGGFLVEVPAASAVWVRAARA